jgi:hypothetical protein
MMHRTVRASIVGATMLLATAASTAACEIAASPDAYVDTDYPSADFVATTEPVYVGGHAAYWYHGRWFYRDGAHWGHYDREPPGLSARRAQFGAAGRVNYARPSVRRGGGAGRPARR